MNTYSSSGNRTGIFIAGFRWSGSSAVSDWLESFSSIRKPPDSKTAYDEIRALNYGLTLFLKAVEKPLLYGEKLARYSMYPDKTQWPEIFGKPLSDERGVFSPVIRLLDLLFMTAAKNRLNPPIDTYAALLDSNICGSYRTDSEYEKTLVDLVCAVRAAVKNKPSSWAEIADDKNLKAAVSGFLAFFYDRLSAGGIIPVFDNAFSGLNPRYYDLVSPEYFPRQLIVFVIRDPRDQFAEQVKYSTKTFPFMAPKFASDYSRLISKTYDYASSGINARSVPGGRVIKIIGFEDFVFDTGNARTELENIIKGMLDEAGCEYRFDHSVYQPEKSMKNIGVWKNSGMKKEITLISGRLGKYLKPQADS